MRIHVFLSDGDKQTMIRLYQLLTICFAESRNSCHSRKNILPLANEYFIA